MPDESIKTRQFRWGEMAKIVDWLQQVMKEKGLSQSDLARLLGVERQVIYKTLKGKRRLTSDELVQLQTKLGVSPDSPSPSEPIVNNPLLHPVHYVKVVGEVAGGLWRDVTYSDFEEFEIPIVSDPRWPPEALSALVVRGQSINRKASDGDYVLVLDVNYAPRDFREDDWVVVERRDGDKVETTVKRVGRNGDGSWLLLPDSTDPRWQEPLHLLPNQPNDGIEIRVTAFVLDFIKPATKL